MLFRSELQHMGFKTVEQLAETTDDVKRRLGTLSKFVKIAKDWIESANSSQFQVTALKQQLEREQRRTEKLEQQVELLMQRVEANEGTDMRSARKEVIRSVVPMEEEIVDYGQPLPETEPVKRRGRPRKV